MNTTLLAMLPGLLVGAGLGVAALALAPRTVRAADALDRLGEAAVSLDTPTLPLSRWDRAGSWTAQHLPPAKIFLPPTRDLDLLEIPVSAFYARKLQMALLGFLGAASAAVVFQLFGLASSPAALLLTPLASLLLVASPIIALIMWLAPDGKVKQKAAAARREFVRFVGAYLQLVAVALLGNTTADAALDSAASVSDTWVFRRIRREYAAADLTRTTKWDALEILGGQLDVPALSDLGRTMRMAEARVGLRDQLLASAEKLRTLNAAADRDMAERATKRIDVPVFLTLVPILLIVMIPPIATLFHL